MTNDGAIRDMIKVLDADQDTNFLRNGVPPLQTARKKITFFEHDHDRVCTGTTGISSMFDNGKPSFQARKRHVAHVVVT